MLGYHKRESSGKEHETQNGNLYFYRDFGCLLHGDRIYLAVRNGKSSLSRVEVDI